MQVEELVLDWHDLEMIQMALASIPPIEGKRADLIKAFELLASSYTHHASGDKETQDMRAHAQFYLHWR